MLLIFGILFIFISVLGGVSTTGLYLYRIQQEKRKADGDRGHVVTAAVVGKSAYVFDSFPM